MATPLKHGDFTGLADDYARFRPAYATQIATALRGYLTRPTGSSDAVDVGAGTGIWTRMLAALGFRSVTAVEPNDDMRARGIESSGNSPISWRKGSAESTGLRSHSCDLVTMASSFHWARYEIACAEFQRILRPGGVFSALWNPRLIEASPLLVEIESEISRLTSGIKRVSSGRSEFTDRLADRLSATDHFTDVIYMEGRHTIRQAPDEYLGVWRSVNDLQVQMGADAFQKFLDYVARRTASLDWIETTYVTRMWAARYV